MQETKIVNLTEYKKCKGCGETLLKTKANFSVNKAKSDGFDIYCKICRNGIYRMDYIAKKKNKKESYEVNGFNGINEIYC